MDDLQQTIFNYAVSFSAALGVFVFKAMYKSIHDNKKEISDFKLEVSNHFVKKTDLERFIDKDFKRFIDAYHADQTKINEKLDRIVENKYGK